MVATITAVGAPVVTWIAGRRRSGIDALGAWDKTTTERIVWLADELSRVQVALAAEIGARRELEARFGRAIRRIEHLEAVLDAHNIPYNGPPI